MKKALVLALFLALPIIGCTQVPPSPPPTVAVSWPAAVPCTSCTYVVSRCTVSTGTSCPSYTPLNQAAPTSATSYTDATPPTGVSVLYVVQSVQSGLTGQPSPPSNLLAVPTYPGTPGTPNATATAELASPIVNEKQPEVMASNHPAPIIVTVKLQYPRR